MHATENHLCTISLPLTLEVNENNDNLKDFLVPALRITGILKGKNFGASMKSDAQALGMEISLIDRKELKT